ncbi:MAG: HAD family hydrolase [Nitrospinaceae bacterium]
MEAHFSLVLDYLLLQRGWELTPTEKKDLLSIYYKELFRQRRVYPDVEPTLQALRKEGVRMGIVSNTTNPPFMKDYERGILGLDLFFDWTIYSSQVPFRKPHPSIFRLAIDRMGCAPADILFVGDNLKADILGAQAVGMAGAWLNRDRGLGGPRPVGARLSRNGARRGAPGDVRGAGPQGDRRRVHGGPARRGHPGLARGSLRGMEKRRVAPVA